MPSWHAPANNATGAHQRRHLSYVPLVGCRHGRRRTNIVRYYTFDECLLRTVNATQITSNICAERSSWSLSTKSSAAPLRSADSGDRKPWWSRLFATQQGNALRLVLEILSCALNPSQPILNENQSCRVFQTPHFWPQRYRAATVGTSPAQGSPAAGVRAWHDVDVAGLLARLLPRRGRPRWS